MPIPVQPDGLIRRPPAVGSVEKVLYDILDQFFTQSNYIAGYMPAGIDQAGDPSYFGFFNPSGHYYIQKVNEATGLVTYYVGKDSDNFATDWANRAALVYVDSYLLNFM